MPPITVNKILTHSSPDLDAMMSVLLLREFGKEQFPGADSAEIIFSSAGTLPDGLSTNQLEKKGILAVDIGGGRFDSHPSKITGKAKVDRSATDLLAEALGVIDDPRWSMLIEYSRLKDTTGHSLYSTDILHHFSSLSYIFKGLSIVDADNDALIMEKGLRIISNLPYFIEHKDEPYDQEGFKACIDLYIKEKNIDLANPLDEHVQLQKWYEKLNTKFKSIYGKRKMDQLASMAGIYHGAMHRYGSDQTAIQEIINLCLDCIIIRERNWYQALRFYDENVYVHKIGLLVLVTIECANGLVFKAARLRHKPDIIIYRNPDNGAYTIFIQRRGRLNKFPFEKIVARIRIAEAVFCKEEIDFENLEALDTHHGWFLHQSLNFLIRGSNRQNDFVPSKLPLDLVNQLVYSEFDKEDEFQLLPKKVVEAIWKYKNPFFR